MAANGSISARAVAGLVSAAAKREPLHRRTFSPVRRDSREAE